MLALSVRSLPLHARRLCASYLQWSPIQGKANTRRSWALLHRSCLSSVKAEFLTEERGTVSHRPGAAVFLMAYRLDSLRIIDVESTDEAAQTHQPPHVICRTFGFPKADSPVNTRASVSHCASLIGNSPDASSDASAGARAVPGAASPACATGLLFGGDCSTRPSKRVGIFRHDEHEDWDFLKSGDIGHSTRLEATQPGLIMSTLNRGLAHVPDRRPLTEAEIVAAASKEIRMKANAPVRQHQMLRYMGTSHKEAAAGGRKHFEVPCRVGEILRDNTAEDMQRLREQSQSSPQPPH